MNRNHLDLIKGEYDSFIKHLLKNGRLPAKDTGIGYWGITHCDDLYELFTRISLQNHKSFADLGSGDGRVVLIASLFNVKAIGIEADRWLIEQSTHIRRKLDLPNFRNTRFLMDDFMKRDFSTVDVIFVSPDKPFHRGLEVKLANELKGKLIVHGHEFQPEFMKKESEHIINGDKFCVYKKN